jgi:hypothetical protein
MDVSLTTSWVGGVEYGKHAKPATDSAERGRGSSMVDQEQSTREFQEGDLRDLLRGIE